MGGVWLPYMLLLRVLNASNMEGYTVNAVEMYPKHMPSTLKVMIAVLFPIELGPSRRAGFDSSVTVTAKSLVLPSSNAYVYDICTRV